MEYPRHGIFKTYVAEGNERKCKNMQVTRN